MRFTVVVLFRHFRSKRYQIALRLVVSLTRSVGASKIGATTVSEDKAKTWKYGSLYNWFTVKDVPEICPKDGKAHGIRGARSDECTGNTTIMVSFEIFTEGLTIKVRHKYERFFGVAAAIWTCRDSNF